MANDAVVTSTPTGTATSPVPVDLTAKSAGKQSFGDGRQKMTAAQAYAAAVADGSIAPPPTVAERAAAIDNANAPEHARQTLAQVAASTGRSTNHLPQSTSVSVDDSKQVPRGNPASEADPQPGTLPSDARDTNPQPADPQPQTQRRMLTVADLADADMTIVVDGKPITMAAKDAIARLQRGESANKKYEEAARIREETLAYREHLTATLSDPAALRRELIASGYNAAEIAKALYEQEQIEASLTPEQRRMRELEEQVAQHQAEREAQAARAHEAQVQAHRDAYARDFGAAIDAHNVPADHPIRSVLMQMLAQATMQAKSEGRNYTKGEAKALVASVVTPYREPAPQLTQEDVRSKITAEDVAAWHAAQKAAKVQAAAVEVRPSPSQPRVPAGAPGGGQWTTPQRDRNGRRVIQNAAQARRDYRG